MKYEIDMDDKFVKTIDRLIDTTTAKTKAEVIQRAVATYAYLIKNSKKLTIIDGARITEVNIPR